MSLLLLLVNQPAAVADEVSSPYLLNTIGRFMASIVFATLLVGDQVVARGFV